ncbi:MAG: heme exporter protein CcmD [Roseovarius sp.]|uniref:heme exporter protein CcmD n=1 Tax=Roseovarius sp. TaxID=1486281 RepID=UPI00262ECB52|nr:heme exporter protein CcmD [Roseovarius sp.]
MMPDLGKYADAVLSSYAVSILMIVVVVLLSVRRSNRVKRELQELESKVKSNG